MNLIFLSFVLLLLRIPPGIATVDAAFSPVSSSVGGRYRGQQQGRLRDGSIPSRLTVYSSTEEATTWDSQGRGTRKDNHLSHDDDDSTLKLHPITTVVLDKMDSKILPRILSKKEYDDFFDQNDDSKGCGRPILIQGVLSSAGCHECCERLLSVADDVYVDLQEQKQPLSTSRATTTTTTQADSMEIQKTTTRVFPGVSLSDALDVIMRRSNSYKSYFAFCEGLLEEGNHPTLKELQHIATSVRERLFVERDDPDLFPYFPTNVQPTDALILAGAGATSTLHRDPMEWTGTSLCLEGTKVWRFLEPPPTSLDGQRGRDRVLSVDKALKSYRLESVAWQSHNNHEEEDHHHEGSVALSAGWQSDYSLYRTRDHEKIPSAEILADMEEEEEEKKMDLLRKLNSLDVLRPDIPPDASIGAIHTVIQKPGDLLLIPAHWWHQTYAFEPSVAIASQRCGSRDLPLVLDHIWNQVHGNGGHKGQTSDDGRHRHVSSKSPQDSIALFFEDLFR